MKPLPHATTPTARLRVSKRVGAPECSSQSAHAKGCLAKFAPALHTQKFTNRTQPGLLTLGSQVPNDHPQPHTRGDSQRE